MRKMNCTLEYVNGHIEVYDGTGAAVFRDDASRKRSKKQIRRIKPAKGEVFPRSDMPLSVFTPKTESA